MSDELGRWAARRAPDLLARAEAEAVVKLRDVLVDAALRTRTGVPAAPPAPAPSPRRAETGEALWAYCVTRADAVIGERPAAVDPTRAGVEPIVRGGLAVHVGRVGLESFGAEPLRENLNDFTWLERVARAHEAVLEAAMAGATIVPLRLCTIFADEDAARAMLDARGPDLAATLDAVEGREEWSVKVLADPRALLAAAARDRGGEPDDADGGSGAAYLLQRRTEREDRAAAERIAARLADDVHARLQDWADGAVLNAPQNRELSGHDGDMLLNGAYLVERARSAGLRALVDELSERHRDLGARLELSGPFPPYNFTTGAEA